MCSVTNKYESIANRLRSEHQNIERDVQQEQNRYQQKQNEKKDTEDAQAIIQTVAKGVQEQAHSEIAAVVSSCMEAVFDEPYEFQIIFEQKRGKTEARLVFVRDGLEVEPMSAAGGGVVDVGAFALRLACLALSQPKRRRLVVLDEPFKFLSAQYRYRVRDMLSSLAKEMGIQFIMVTHIEELCMGTIVRLGE